MTETLKEIMIDSSVVSAPPRMLKATWEVDSIDYARSLFGCYPKRDKQRLKPRFKTAARTVKQRNKLLCNHFLGSYNRDILAHRSRMAKEREMITVMADEIRAEIDAAVIQQLLQMRQLNEN